MSIDPEEKPNGTLDDEQSSAPAGSRLPPTPETDLVANRAMRDLMNAASWERAYREMASHARKLEQARAWQPIATVPLKTDVLLYWPSKMGRTLRPAQQTVGQVNSLCHYAGASHWAPLLSPPENAPAHPPA